MAERQASNAVDAALKSLPERQRTALMLVYKEEMAQAECAEVMGISVKALESPGLNHRFEITSGVLEEDCRAIIQEFFRNRRRTSVDRAERYN